MSSILESIWIRTLLLVLIFLASVAWLLYLVRVARPDLQNRNHHNKIRPQLKSDDQQQKRVFVDDNNNHHHSGNKIGNSLMNDNGPESTSDWQKFTKEHPKEEDDISFPNNIEQLKRLAEILSKYARTHSQYILVLFCSAYLFKQTFAIPGSVFMNLLAGAIYGTWLAFPLCCLLTATGATGCFLLSKMTGRFILEKYFSKKLDYFRQKIREQENENNLLWMLILLRLFPMTPNWFLNIASPIVNIPIWSFFLSVLFGLMPYNFICVQTGSLLSQITSIDDVFTMKTFSRSLLVAVVFASSLLVKRIVAQRNQLKETSEKKLN